MDLTTFTSTADPRAIPDLALPAGLTILVLAPHPDDFDAIGVTLKFLFDKGHTVHVAVARTGGGIDDDGLTLSEKADLREEEQRRSVAFFGLPESCLTVLSLSNDANDELLDCPENRATILALMRDVCPDIVFLPHGNDTNAGHRAMHSLFSDVARQWTRPLVAFLVRDPKTVEMNIDLYMPFGPKEAEWKAELLRFHDSQHQRNLRSRGYGFDERILRVNRAIARELSLDHGHAEAFQIERHNRPEA